MNAIQPNPNAIQDVIIVGAGISGISAACHLHRDCPEQNYTILEARQSLGGTWDLFRYPGIRSDSDMHTFGFSFKPWTNAKAISDGPSILRYLQEAVAEYDVEKHIRFGVRVTSAAWDSESSTWTVTTLSDRGEVDQVTGRLLYMCSGYYNYEKGYTPDFAGLDTFKGKVIHPQHWPRDLDYQNKRVAVIGSGATAVTLVPSMADTAAHVTMIQRSPTYIVSFPARDRLANLLRKLLPDTWAYAITRWRNIRFQNYVYKRAMKSPQKMRDYLMKGLRKAQISDEDIEKHFSPSYDPWTQRLCLVPDADLFNALNSGKASVVTGQIKSITEDAVQMEDGSTVACDILVTATGLNVQVMGGVEFFLDGESVDFSNHFMYQGMMFSGIPNLVMTFGYINASWTLRADLNSRFVCGLLKEMDSRGAAQAVPLLRDSEKDMPAYDWLTNFNPGYFQRAMHKMPRQGDHAPWHNTQDYLLDRKLLRNGPQDDGVLTYRGSRKAGSGEPGHDTEATRTTHAAQPSTESAT